MSKKKISTKSGKSKASKRAIASYIKKWNREPDAADKRFYSRNGRWPSKAEFAFWDTQHRFPRAGELAKRTRDAKKEKAAKRSIAAKRAAQTRRLKSPEVRQWERTRRALQAAQNDEINAAIRRGIKRPLRAHRWYDHFFISLSRMSVEEIHALLLAMKQRGVRAFRIEREVPVGDRGRTSEISPAGFASTKWQFMPRISESDLRHGNSKTGLPSLEAMRSPGIDVMRYLVVEDRDVANYFPMDIKRDFFKLKKETRETIRTKDAEVFYLSKGRKPTAKQIKQMEKQRKQIDNTIEQLEEEIDDEEFDEGES